MAWGVCQGISGLSLSAYTIIRSFIFLVKPGIKFLCAFFAEAVTGFRIRMSAYIPFHMLLIALIIKVIKRTCLDA
jgi:hypothetical protein